jgi:hypothetical protein
MDIRRGTVTKFHSSISVSGGENNSGVTTRHHTSFTLDGLTVMFVSAAPPVINDGDQLIVAGRQQGRVIKAYAYRNLSMHVTGSEGAWKSLGEALGCLFLACVSFWLSFFLFPISNPQDTSDIIVGIIAGVAGVVLISASLYYFSRWLKVREAVKRLERHY